jgi:sucrose 6(F)-phosphate phosphorylase
MPVKNQVQLITYPDSLGGDLDALHQVLQRYFADACRGGIHILPPFPSSGDRGFAPLTYLEIEPRFGSWSDIRRIGERCDVLLDLMVNHISRQSVYFQDFLEHGRRSRYADLFITPDQVWPGGDPPREEIDRIFLRRTEPFSRYTIRSTGKVERVWTTFGRETPSEQVDLNVKSEGTRRLLGEYLANFGRQKIKIVRLDAVGYVVKKPATSCFFVEPEIYDFLDWISELAGSLGIELLPEVHAHHSIQLDLARRGYWTYDFALPYLVLDALLNKTSRKLTSYLKNRPPRQFTMLDCQDGIPVKPDLDGLVDAESARKLVDVCLARGANLSRVFSPRHQDPSGFDVHQIRIAYYSALGEDDDAYLAARALQFFTPGVPQVYYAGLLAGANDAEGVRQSGEGRAINRRNYTMSEIDGAVRRPVVQRLLRLIRFRNDHPAFGGAFEVLDSGESQVRLSWRKGERTCALSVDLDTGRAFIDYVDDSGKVVTYSV